MLPQCTWNLYPVAASFNFPRSMIQIEIDCEQNSDDRSHINMKSRFVNGKAVQDTYSYKFRSLANFSTFKQQTLGPGVVAK